MIDCTGIFQSTSSACQTLTELHKDLNLPEILTRIAEKVCSCSVGIKKASDIIYEQINGLGWTSYSNSVRYKPSKSSNTVHGHAAAGLVSELHLQQVQPVINHLVWRSRAIIKGPVLGEHNVAHTPHVLTEQTACSVFKG